MLRTCGDANRVHSQSSGVLLVLHTRWASRHHTVDPLNHGRGVRIHPLEVGAHSTRVARVPYFVLPWWSRFGCRPTFYFGGRVFPFLAVAPVTLRHAGPSDWPGSHPARGGWERTWDCNNTQWGEAVRDRRPSFVPTHTPRIFPSCPSLILSYLILPSILVHLDRNCWRACYPLRGKFGHRAWISSLRYLVVLSTSAAIPTLSNSYSIGMQHSDP